MFRLHGTSTSKLKLLLFVLFLSLQIKHIINLLLPDTNKLLTVICSAPPSPMASVNPSVIGQLVVNVTGQPLPSVIIHVVLGGSNQPILLKRRRSIIVPQLVFYFRLITLCLMGIKPWTCRFSLRPCWKRQDLNHNTD